MAGSPDSGTVERRKPGRPTRLNKRILRKVLYAIRAGNYRETAFTFAGIGARTGYTWMSRGAKDEEEGFETRFSLFRQAVVEAEARAQIRAVGCLRRAATGDWKAAAWYLERKHRENWGRVTKEEVDQPDSYAQAVADFLQDTEFTVPIQPDTVAPPEEVTA